LLSGTRQCIPPDGYVFISAVRNMGTDGLMPGRSVRPTDRENLDQTDPNWHTETSPDAKAYLYDSRNRREFEISPGQPKDGRGSIEIIYAKSPDDAKLEVVDDDNMKVPGKITIDDIYEPALVNYVLHRACSKDPASPEDIGKSASYLEMFIQMITGNADQKELELLVRHQPKESGSTTRQTAIYSWNSWMYSFLMW